MRTLVSILTSIFVLFLTWKGIKLLFKVFISCIFGLFLLILFVGRIVAIQNGRDVGSPTNRTELIIDEIFMSDQQKAARKHKRDSLKNEIYLSRQRTNIQPKEKDKFLYIVTGKQY